MATKKNVSLLVMFCVLVAQVCGGATYYVNNTAGVGSDDYDGLSAVYDGEHGPKFTIQSAVDCAQDGDTVSVAPGVYGAEQGGTARTDDCHAYRIRISKNITLVAPAGREKTVIEGALGTNANQCNKDSFAAIVIDAEASGVKISGFTFRDCSTSQTANWSNLPGAAVLFLGEYVGVSGQPWITDCAADNCATYRGAFGKVNVARTIIRGCRTYGNCAGGYQCNFFHCLFYRNGDGDNSVFYRNPVVCGGDYVVNSSFVRNVGPVSASGNDAPKYIYNTVVAESDNNSNTRATTIKNLVIHEQSACITASVKENIYASRKFQLAAPVFGDFRPLAAVEGVSANAVAATAGSATLLEVIPEEYRWKDVYGKEFSAVDGVIAAGAVQTVMTPVAGFATTTAVVDGISPLMELSGYQYQMGIFTDEWPKIYKLSNLLDNKPDLFAYFVSANGKMIVPDGDGEALYVPQNGVMANDVSAVVATEIRYVAKTGSDSTGDGTADNPYLTIQKAVDSITDGVSVYGVVRVEAGTYDDRGSVGTGAQDTIANVVSVNHVSSKVAIRSLQGAANTFIKGAASEEGDAGLGSDAVRCVRLCSSGHYIRGFTLLNGHTAGDGELWQDRCGGAVNGGGEGAMVVDCVISNCAGYNVGAVYNCSILRTRLHSNRGENGSIVSGGRCINSVAAGNYAKSVVLDAGVSAVNCTFYEGATQGVIPSKHEYVVNSIIARSNPTASNQDRKLLSGCLFGDGTYTYNSGTDENKEGTDFIYGDPLFVNVDLLDFRLATASPAFANPISAWNGASGNWTDDLLYENYYAHIAADMEGNDPVFINGNPTIGAYFKSALQSVSVSAEEGFAVEATSSGSVEFGTEITVTATATGNRPLEGFEVNGERVTGVSSYTFTTSSDTFVPVFTVKAVSPSPMIWYVDANEGDDANNGWSEETARRTLAAMMPLALPGDVVMAMPGVYAEGEMLQNAKLTNDPCLPSRVVVLPGVTLESRCGPEATIIRGERGVGGGAGLGEGAMRCVFVQTNGCLRGFTLTGGATLTGDGKDIDNYCGGGVASAENSRTVTVPTIRIENCIISNNVAKLAGGGVNGSYVQCRFLYNIGTEGSGAVGDALNLFECLVDWNRGAEAVADPQNVVGCTFGENNYNASKTALAPALVCDPGVATWTVKNSLFLGGATCRVRYAYDVAVPENWALATSQATSVRENVISGDVSVDDDYRPLITSVAVDAADPGLRPDELPDTDLLGGQRVYNGAMDIGALEADWRVKYAEAASPSGRRFSVEAADPAVTLSSDGAVLIPDGASVSVRYRGYADGTFVRYRLRFNVLEQGASLVATVNGTESVFETIGEHSLEFTSVQPLNDIQLLSCNGSVELLGCAADRGFSVFIR